MEHYSEFYREGFLNKAGKGIIQAHLHSWRPRYFVLNGLQLKYYKTKPSKEMLADNLLGCIDVSEMESVSIMKNEKKAFQITTKSPKPRTYYMSGKSDDEIQGWMKCLSMAKTIYEEKEEKKPSDASLYDEPTVNKNPPTKPLRSPKSSAETSDSLSPASPVSPAANPVISQYALVGLPTDSEKATDQKTVPIKVDDTLYQDPTYDSIDDKEATKNKKQPLNKNSEQDADLYDDVSSATVTKEAKSDKSTNKNPEEDLDLYDAPATLPKKTTSKKKSRASVPIPAATVPPPLPARLPSMSDEAKPKAVEKDKTPVGNPIGVYDEVGSPNIPDTTKAPIGLYDDVGDVLITTKAPIGLYSEVGTPNISDTTEASIGLCDEVGTPDLPITTNFENQYPIGLYEEIGSHDIPIKADLENIEATSESPAIDPTHVYAKPLKSPHDIPIKADLENIKAKSESPAIDQTHVYAKPIKSPQNSLKKKRTLSKRKLLPGLMDVGEVSIDAEEDAAGGRETLERGMTKPSGDRFAIEELREVLTEYDQEINNNGGEMLENFDENQSESAFEVLRRFLERCS